MSKQVWRVAERVGRDIHVVPRLTEGEQERSLILVNKKDTPKRKMWVRKDKPTSSMVQDGFVAKLDEDDAVASQRRVPVVKTRPGAGEVSDRLRCEVARTQLHFDTRTEVDKYIARYPSGSIFWTHDGRKKTIVHNLYKAADIGLDYDVAAEVYVCRECLSCAPNSWYFKLYHNNCSELCWNHEAIIATKDRFERVDTFEVFPRFATQEQEQLVVDWMENCINWEQFQAPQTKVDYTIMNSKTQEVETRQKEIDVSLAGIMTTTISTTLRHEINGTAKSLKYRHKANKVVMRTQALGELIQEVVELCDTFEKPLEFVDVKMKSKKFPRIPLKHMREQVYHHELDVNDDMFPECQGFIDKYQSIAQPNRLVLDADIKPGWSGVVLHKQDLEPHLHASCDGNLFVVMGRCEHGDLQNALKPTCLEGVTFYSDMGMQALHRTLIGEIEHSHQWVDSNQKEEVWVNFGLWVQCMNPLRTLKCGKCLAFPTTADYISNMTRCRAFNKLANDAHWSAKFFHRHIVTIASELQYVETRNRFNRQEGENRLFVQPPNLGPLYDVSNYINQSVVEINRTFHEIQLTIQNGQYNEQMRAQKVLQEIAKVRDMEFLQVDKIRNTAERIAKTYNTLLAQANLPLSLHTLRQLMMDTRMDESFEFDIARTKGSIANIIPTAFRLFTNIFTTPGVYNEDWVNLTPDKRLITDLDYLRSDKQVSDFKAKEHVVEHEALDEGTCFVKVGGELVAMCVQAYKCHVPIPHVIRIGNPTNPALMRIQDQFGGNTHVPKNGYCYVIQFILMLGFVQDAYIEGFSAMLEGLVAELGAWPTFEAYLNAIKNIVIRYPTTIKAPTALHIVDHKGKYIHVMATLGCVNKNQHYLNLNTVAHLFDIAAITDADGFYEYKIGGIVKNLPDLKRMLSSKEDFEEILLEQPRWLVHVLLSPTQIWALSVAVQKYRITESILGKNPDIAFALCQLCNASKQMGILETVNHVVSQYFQLLKRIDESAATILGPNYEQFQLTVTQYAAAYYSADAAVLLESFSTEKNTIVLLEGYYRETIPDVLVELGLLERSSMGRSARYRYRCGRVAGNVFNATLRSSGDCLTRVKRISWQGVKSGTTTSVSYLWRGPLWCVGWLSSTTGGLTFRTTFHLGKNFIKRAIRKVCSDVASNACVMALMYFVLKGLRKLISWLEYIFKAEVRPDEDETIVQHAAQKSDNLFTYILAWLALLAGCIDTGFGNDLYFATTKYKTLMTIATAPTPETLVFHAGDEDREIEELVNTQHSFIDYQFHAEDRVITADTEPLHSWYDRINVQGRVVEHPLKSPHVWTLTKDGSTELARCLATLQGETEVTIVGGVGTGKSTKFPGALSIYGPVLILVPSQDLGWNLLNSLQHVCGKTASLYMMNVKRYGNSNITIMTYGYALMRFANNPKEIQQYRFIQMDECHEFSDHMIGFYSWWKDHGKHTKLYKTTATPPGTIINAQTGVVDTNYKVEVKKVPEMRVEEFCRKSVDGHAHGLQGLFPEGGRIIVFAPSRSDCDKAKVMLLNMPSTKVWCVHGSSTCKTDELIDQLGTDHSRFQIILTTTVLQNGVNLDPYGAVCFGKTYEMVYDRDLRELGLAQRPINPGELIQRVGRVGRSRPGKFVQVGDRITHEAAPNACSVTNAIMLTFSLDLAPYVGPHLIDEINWVTKEQVTTAMQFGAPLLFMVHYIRRDGRMLKGFYQHMKGLLLHTTEIELCDTIVGDAPSNQFRTLRQYQLSGQIQSDDVLPDWRIPFYHHKFALPFYMEIGRITEDALRQRTISMRLSAAPTKHAVMRLSTAKTEIDKTIGLLRYRLVMLRERLAKYEEMRLACSQVKHTRLWNVVCMGGMTKDEDNVRASIRVGNELLSALEMAATEKDDKAAWNLIEANPLLKDYLVQHAAPEEYLDKFIPTRRSLPVSLIIAIIGLIVTLGVMVYSYFWKKKEKLVQHGKQARVKDSKVKRKHLFTEEEAPAPTWTGTDQAIEERFGQAYTRRWQGKAKPGTWDDSKAVWDSREGNQTRPYQTLYDVDITKFKQVIVECPEFGLKKTLNRQERKDLSTTILEAVRSKMEKEGIYDYPRVEQATVYLIGDDGKPSRKVQLTPHDPLIASRTTGKPVGYPIQKGRLRQTGQAIELSQEELQHVVEPHLEQHARTQISTSHIDPHLAIISTGQFNTHCFVTYKHCIAPYHLARGLKDKNTKLTMYTASGVYKFRLPDVQQIDDMDLVVFKMPPDFPPMKRMKAFRCPRDDDEVMLLTTERDHAGAHTYVSKVTRIQYKASWKMWRYSIESKPGLCGGAVMCADDERIVGFHSAGSYKGVVASGAYFTPVTKQLLDLLNQDLSDDLVEWKYNDKMIAWRGVSTNIDPSNFPTSETIEHFIQHNGKDHPSDKYFGECLTIQGRIIQTFNNRHVIKGTDDKFDEYKLTIKEPPTNPLTQLPSDLSMEAFFKDFLKYDTPVELGDVDVVSFKQAIQNVISHFECMGFTKGEFAVEYDMYKILNSFNLDTAMGAMYQSKKKDVLPLATHEQLETWFHASLENLLQGKMGIWKASCKAELRPKEKVLAKKTRVFTAAPFDVLFGAKAFVDGFNNKFYTSQSGSHWTVGINKFNCGWDELARRFNHAWKFIDADGSRYDSNLTPLMFNAIVHIREYFMSMDDVEAQAFRNYYTQLVWTPISTITGQIIKKNKGGPSGQPSTVVDNTIMLMVAIEYSKIKANMRDDQIIYVCNGDDLLINGDVSSCALVRECFSDTMRELGMCYEFEKEVDSIGEVEYMSHVWLNLEGILIPKLKRERIMGIVQWCRSFDLDSQANKLNAAWIESFGYPELMEYIKNYADWWAEQTGMEHFLCSEEKVAKLYLTDEVHIEQQEWLVQHAELNTSGPVPTPTTSTPAATPVTTSPATTSSANVVVTNPPASGGGQSGLRETASTTSNINALYLPPMMKKLSEVDTIKKMALYTPPDALISLQASTLKQFNEWAQESAKGYGVTDDQFRDEIVPYFIYWCIVNGASEQHKKQTHWVKVQFDISADFNTITMNAATPQVEYELEPILRFAKPTLRNIMRHFGQIAYRWVKFSLQRGQPIKPHNAIKAGLTDMKYFPCSIDFVTNDILSPDEVNVRNQVLNARVGKNPRPLFGHATRAGAEDEDTNLRMPDDANYGRTQMGGAFFGRQPM